MNLPWIHTLASSGPRQHFAESVFRAVETRLPVVRAANTGISAVIDSSGQIMKMLPWDQSGAFTADVPIASHPLTFYVRHGDWFAQICLAILCAGAAVRVYAWAKRRKQRKADQKL
jgi:apolipoprotein N-acyltransferase